MLIDSHNPHGDIGGHSKVSIFSTNRPCNLHEGMKSPPPPQESTWLPARSLSLLLMLSKTLVFCQCNCRIISKLSPEFGSCSSGAGGGIDGCGGGVGEEKNWAECSSGESGNSKETPASSRKGDPRPPQHRCSVKRKESLLGSQKSP